MNMEPTYFWNFWVNMFWQIFFWFLTVKSTKFWRNLFWREIWITELRHLAALTETSERDVFKKRKQNKNLSYEKKIFRIIWKSRNGDKIRGRSRWSGRQWPNPDQFTDQRTTNHWGNIETSFLASQNRIFFNSGLFVPKTNWTLVEHGKSCPVVHMDLLLGHILFLHWYDLCDWLADNSSGFGSTKFNFSNHHGFDLFFGIFFIDFKNNYILYFLILRFWSFMDSF